MHVLAVGRVPCPWRFGTHGRGTKNITVKGLHLLAYLHEDSQPDECLALGPILAVGLDVVNPGCNTAHEPILLEFLFLSVFVLFCFVLFSVIYFYNEV